MANSNFTKVICSNCGAEIIIPNNEVKNVMGTVIGKNSGLGTVVLPTVEKDKSVAFNRLMKMAQGNPEMISLINTISEGIDEEGYLDVNGIVRRWIPSQCLGMLFSHYGFHHALTGKGYDYGWRVLLNELEKQSKLYLDGDKEGLADRNRWYNKELVLDMANGYLEALKKRVSELKVRHHGRRKYVRLTCKNINAGKGVYVSEIQERVYKPLEKFIHMIERADNASVLFQMSKLFDNFRKGIHWKPATQCNSFLNSYKAAGAYYTMKDLILFEDCKMMIKADGTTGETWSRDSERKMVSTDKSLEALDKTVDDMIDSRWGVREDGYKLLGLLKDFLEYNNFDFADTKMKWKNQHELRMANRKPSRRYNK